MEQYTKAEFAKNSENKEGPDFTDSVREEGLLQGSIIYSKLYNTMLGELTKYSRSLSKELTNILADVGMNPSDDSSEQLVNAIKRMIKNNATGVQIGDLLPNIGTEPPTGRMLCNGQWVNNCKVVFPDFYEYVTTKTPYVTPSVYQSQINTYGQCGFCAVSGDDVRLPTINRPISGVSNISQTGQAILDTMRPITGAFGNRSSAGFASGAFYLDGGTSTGRYYRDDWTQFLHFNSGRLGERYNGSETRGKQVQYPYCIQVYTGVMEQSLVDVSELIDLIKYQAQLGIQNLPASSGTIQLVSGAIYNGTITGNTQFVLPTVSDTSLLNQILIQLTIQSDADIDWGTINYFSGNPSSSAGVYNIIYEYDAIQAKWYVGQVEKI